MTFPLETLPPGDPLFRIRTLFICHQYYIFLETDGSLNETFIFLSHRMIPSNRIICIFFYHKLYLTEYGEKTLF